MSHYLIAIILAGCCIVYGILVLMVGSGTVFFAVWFGLAVLILLTVFLPGELQKTAHAAGLVSVLKWLLRIVWILIGVSVAVTWTLIATEFRDRGKPGLDYLIVLGAQVNRDGPSLSLEYRLDAARNYLDENPDTICIVSGGQGWNEPETEAAAMKRWLVEHGIPEKRIICENQSRDTHENIVNSRAIILEREGLKNGRLTSEKDAVTSVEVVSEKNQKSLMEEDSDETETVQQTLNKFYVGIVTNDFHVFRGVHLARRAGFVNAEGIAAKSTRLYLLNNMLRETLGMIKDWVCGNLA